MNFHFILCIHCILLGSISSFAQANQIQTEREKIISVINNYIVGTSYNDADQIKSAFMPGANMFLDHKDKPLFVMKIEEYASRVAKHNPGVFNGRVSSILSIDQFEGIAMAKLEVIVPSIERTFIDMILLKKLSQGWKIISKTAGGSESNNQGLKALIVVSNSNFHGESSLPAGNSFSEIVIAYDTYVQAGYHVDFVSPNGGSIPLAYINPSNNLQLKHLYNSDFMYALEHTIPPSLIHAKEYDIIQFTGGSAPIFDIPDNVEIQDIAMQIYRKSNGVIAAVCHGTAGIVNLKTSDNNYLVTGKIVNGVPDEHESKSLPHYAYYPFIIEQLLTQRGGQFRHAPVQTPHMEVDGKLVTGQNSLSSKMVTLKSIEISQGLSH